VPYVWQETKHKVAGNADGAISPYLKTWIKRGDSVFCAVTGEGSTLSLSSNWETPFDGANAGSFFQKAGGLLQMKTEGTTQTLLNSTQVWGGNQPLSITLNLLLYTLNDSIPEVENALTLLKEFASPEVNAISPVGNLVGGEASLGRIPDKVMLNVGRNFIYPKCVIGDISEPFDVVKDSKGNRLQASISVTLETESMINKSQVSSLTTSG